MAADSDKIVKSRRLPRPDQNLSRYKMCPLCGQLGGFGQLGATDLAGSPLLFAKHSDGEFVCLGSYHPWDDITNLEEHLKQRYALIYEEQRKNNLWKVYRL